MSDLEHRIKQTLEPILELPDPREKISAYHDMPYALFRYDPEQEFSLRLDHDVDDASHSEGQTRHPYLARAMPSCGDNVGKVFGRLVPGRARERSRKLSRPSPTFSRNVRLWSIWWPSRCRPLPIHTRCRLDQPNRRAVPGLPHVLFARTTQGTRACPDDPLLSRRSRWGVRASFHGRARCRAQLPAQDLLKDEYSGQDRINIRE